MSIIKGVYETANKDTIQRDYLLDEGFDGSLIIVKDATGLRNADSEFNNHESAIYYIKPGKCSHIHEAILYITTLFNQYTQFENKQGNKVCLMDLASNYKC